MQEWRLKIELRHGGGLFPSLSSLHQQLVDPYLLLRPPHLQLVSQQRLRIDADAVLELIQQVLKMAGLQILGSDIKTTLTTTITDLRDE